MSLVDDSPVSLRTMKKPRIIIDDSDSDNVVYNDSCELQLSESNDKNKEDHVKHMIRRKRFVKTTSRPISLLQTRN